VHHAAAFRHDGQVNAWSGRLSTRQKRLARTVVLGLVIGLGIGNLYWSFAQWTLSDAGAYWHAAQRLREGAGLYPVVTNVEASDVYRYAPWFAWLAIPFTYLPVRVAGAVWSLILVLASIAAVVPMARRQGWIQVSFFFPILIGISAVGNVHALMIAWLVWGVERRSGPLWIALAASLKGVPFLLTLVYVGRRQWGRAAATLVLTILLVAPAFLYDLRGYVTDAGSATMLTGTPILFAGVVAVVSLITMAAARGRFAWLAASAAVVLATPRFFIYDISYLLVSFPSSPRDTTTRPTLRPGAINGS